MLRFFLGFFILLSSCSDGSRPYKTRGIEFKEPYDFQEVTKVMTSLSSKNKIILSEKYLKVYGTLLSTLFGTPECRVDTLEKNFAMCEKRYNNMIKNIDTLFDIFGELVNAPPSSSGSCHLLRSPLINNEFIRVLNKCGETISAILLRKHGIELNPAVEKDQTEEKQQEQEEQTEETTSYESTAPIAGLFYINQDFDSSRQVKPVDLNLDLNSRIKAIKEDNRYRTNLAFYQDLKSKGFNFIIVENDPSRSLEKVYVTQALLAKEAQVSFLMKYHHPVRLNPSSFWKPDLQAEKLDCKDKENAEYYDIQKENVRKSIIEAYQKDWEIFKGSFAGYLLDENLGFFYDSGVEEACFQSKNEENKTTGSSDQFVVSLSTFVKEWNEAFRKTDPQVKAYLTHYPTTYAREKWLAYWDQWEGFEQVFLKLHEDYMQNNFENSFSFLKETALKEKKGLSLVLEPGFSFAFPYCPALEEALKLKKGSTSFLIERSLNYKREDLSPYLMEKACLSKTEQTD